MKHHGISGNDVDAFRSFWLAVKPTQYAECQEFLYRYGEYDGDEDDDEKEFV